MKIIVQEQLQKLIEEYGTINAMATHCGISRQSLGFYLSGKRLPDIVSLCKISEETGHSIDWIVFGKPDEKSIKDFKERTFNALQVGIFQMNALCELLKGETTDDT